MSEKAFEKRFAGMLEQPGDIDFFRSCFERRDGAFALKADIDAASMKRLNRLAKAIKANRGLFKAGPLVAAAIVVGGLAVFGIFFMNPTLEKAAEAGLSAAFGAGAEVSGLRFSPFSLRLSLRSVAVADRDAPITNLFETGRVELRLNPAAALRGKVYIEEAAVDYIAVGTARSVSGALPDEPARVAAARPAKEAAPPLVDLERFDAGALLEREKARLKSAAAYEEAGAAYAEALSRWTARAASSAKAVAELDASARAVLALDPKKLSKPDDVAGAIAAARNALSAAQSARAEAEAVSAGIGQDGKTLAGLERAARTAVADDIAYLKSLVDPSSGAAMAALEPSVREVLSDKAERYVYYALRAYELASRLAAAAKDGAAGARPARAANPRGRDVSFPSAAYPGFRLGLLRSSFGAGGLDWVVEARELSTDPELVPSPSSLTVAASSGGFSASAKAEADLRGGKAGYRVGFDATGLALDLGDALSGAGLAGFTASLAGSGRVEGSSADSFSAGVDMRLSEARVAGASGAFAVALADAISSVDEIRASVAYGKAPGGEASFSLRTNLDAVVLEAVTAMAKGYAREAMAAVEARARAWVASELEGKLASRAELDGLFAGARGDVAAVDRMKAQLDQKIRAFEAQAAALGSSALRGLAIPGLPAVKP